jgi:hypothetical protein
MNSIYPCDKSHRSLFYVEFDRGDKEGEFTLFQRQWLRSESEMEILKKKSPKDFPFLELFNEVHPLNLFTGTYGPDGCIPDKTWVQWMIDALNNQTEADLKSLTESLKK